MIFFQDDTIYLSIASLWTMLFVFYYRYLKHYSKTSNAISFTHATFTIINISFFCTPQLTKKISIGYYIYDMLLNLFFPKNNLAIPMVFHHLASIYILSFINYLHTPLILLMFFLAEISNIPMYMAYWAIKNKKSPLLKNLLTLLEISFFVIFRLLIGGYYLGLVILQRIPCHPIEGILPFQKDMNYECQGPVYSIILVGIFIYIISIKWTYKLLFQVCHRNSNNLIS
jgi:hypothetical protein